MHLRIQARAALWMAALLAAAAMAFGAQTPAHPDFSVLDSIFKNAIGEGDIPGAVVIVGHNGNVVYRKAFGSRAVSPVREAMTADTIFDIASLTKTFTAICVMRMVELGQVRLNDRVSQYMPEFAGNGKEDISIRQLLTHYSGLAPDLDLSHPWRGKETALQMANASAPVEPPGARFVYSDINYIVLGALVERVSGMSLDRYMDAHILQPLGLTTTRFLPPQSWASRIAPADYAERTLGEGLRVLHLRGTVNDPTARRMGGVAGHAGMFSTADDLAKYAQWWLDRDKVLSAATMEKMTTPQQPPNSTVLRGLGWDIDSPFSSNRGELLPVGGFGHTGWTGTSMWIDPQTKTYVIILANATHPHGMPRREVVSLRSEAATAVAVALDLKVTRGEEEKIATITGYNEMAAGERKLANRNGATKTGIDVLEETDFVVLRGGRETTRIGLLTNQTGVDSAGRRTIDVLAKAKGIKLVSIFSPEHGIAGAEDRENLPDAVDVTTGVAVHSLYRAGQRGRLPAELLRDLDVLMVDLQDAGVRFFSYEVMLGYVLESAAEAGKTVMVLDRPNPVTGSFVQGPMWAAEPKTLVSYVPLPVRHGMTMGELAQLFNGERRIGANLRVIAMQGWFRGDWYDSTGLTWVSPSPNLRSVNQATLYPGVALVEGTNVSVGRGTGTPFEVVGAPWINGREFSAYLNARRIPGVRFVPVSFTPTERNYAGQQCQGVNLIVTGRNVLDTPELGIELASALLKLYAKDYRIEKMIEILGNKAVLDAIVAGTDPRLVAEDWRDELQRFQQIRKKHLLY